MVRRVLPYVMEGLKGLPSTQSAAKVSLFFLSLVCVCVWYVCGLAVMVRRVLPYVMEGLKGLPSTQSAAKVSFSFFSFFLLSLSLSLCVWNVCGMAVMVRRVLPCVMEGLKGRTSTKVSLFFLSLVCVWNVCVCVWNVCVECVCDGRHGPSCSPLCYCVMEGLKGPTSYSISS